MVCIPTPQSQKCLIPTNKALCTQQSLKLLIPEVSHSSLTPPHLQILQLDFGIASHTSALQHYQLFIVSTSCTCQLDHPLPTLKSSIWLHEYCILQKEVQPWDVFCHMATHPRFAVALSKGKVGHHDTYSWSHAIHHWGPGADYNQVLVTL